MKAKIIHLVDSGNSYYIEAYIKFVGDHFDISSHEFIDIATLKPVSQGHGKSKNAGVWRAFKFFVKNKNKAIIFHSLFLTKAIYVSLLFCRPSCWSWIIWGGDFYPRTHFKSFFDKVRHKILISLRAVVARKCQYVLSMLQGDYELAKNKYHLKADFLYAVVYPYSINIFNVVERDVSSCKGDYIQIGNSADPSNAHLEVLDALGSSATKGMKLFMPLVYGDKRYKNELEQYISQHFKKDGFLLLESPLPHDEYIKILDNVLVAFFNHKRPQAVGNILLLLSMGKTVYIREDITTWEFLKDHGLIVRSINCFMVDHTIRFLSDEEQQINRVKVRECFSVERAVETWTEVFDQILGMVG